MLEHLSQCSLESADKARGFNVYFLRLADFLVQVLDLHDIKLGHKGVNDLSLVVDSASILKFGTQMELTLNLKLILEHSINPLLEHVGAHGAVQLVAKGLIFKVEFNSCLAVGELNQSKENFNRSLGDRLQGVGLTELYFIAINYLKLQMEVT